MGCLVCGHDHFEPLKKVNWQISGVGSVGVSFALCRNCGHIQQAPLPEPDIISAFYRELSNYVILDTSKSLPERPTEATTHRLMDVARRYGPQKAYEIGCGAGAHLVYLERMGIQVAGNDLSPESAAQAERMISGSIDVGPAENVVPRDNTQQMVILSHVLEHVPDIHSLLAVARDCLSDDGFLALEVPCARQAHHICTGWLAMEHLSYFSEGLLIRVLEAAGFDIVETLIDDTSHVYPTIMVIARPVDRSRFSTKRYASDYDRNRLLMDDVLAIDKDHWQRISARFDGLTDCYVWAAGVHTSQLMAETQLVSALTIKGVIDSSPLKHTKEIGGFTIQSPEEFDAAYKGEPVIISSLVSQNAIYKALRQRGVAEDKIIRLYPHTAGKRDYSN